jgi:transposase
MDMNLNETQRQRVAAWINEGLKLAEIQKRLETEFGLRVTYLDVRLLVDDLKLKPKDPPPPPHPPPPPPPAAPRR